jgi:processive 1,2-diacylglycerol beta-glucosyltransferase
MRRPSVLILTSSIGNDHQQIASVLAEDLYKKGFDPVISDLFAESYPVMANLVQKIMKREFSFFGRMINWLYSGIQQVKTKGFLHPFYHGGKNQLYSLINEHQPVFIISTYPIQKTAYQIKLSDDSIPTYTVIADYQVNPNWINPSPAVDHYFVCSDTVKRELLKQNVSVNRITKSGIPLRTKIETTINKIDKSAVYQKYYLSPHKKIIIVHTSSQKELKNIQGLCQLLLQNPKHQIVAICEKNDNSFEKLIPLAYRYPDSFRLLENVKGVHELYSISHCLITRPSIVTLNEAAVAQVPLILTNPITDQQALNAKYFAENGAAITTNSIKETIEHIKSLSQNKGLIETMKKKLSKIHIAHSLATITNHAINHHKQAQKITVQRTNASPHRGPVPRCGDAVINV